MNKKAELWQHKLHRHLSAETERDKEHFFFVNLAACTRLVLLRAARASCFTEAQSEAQNALAQCLSDFEAGQPLICLRGTWALGVIWGLMQGLTGLPFSFRQRYAEIRSLSFQVVPELVPKAAAFSVFREVAKTAIVPREVQKKATWRNLRNSSRRRQREGCCIVCAQGS